MIKLIVIFASLNVLNIYCQLNCGNFKDDTCGGLTSFKSKCHQFDSGCEEIQVDDGCKFDETHKCVEEKSLGTNEKCYSYSSNNCRRIKHQCTSYIDDNCGDLAGINNLKQCTKLLDYDFCVEIDIDDSCQIKKDGESYICTDNGNVENDFNKNYVCELDKENKSCKKQKKVCSKYTSNCNSIAASTGKTCSKVIDETNCKEVTIDTKCKIDSDGKCVNDASQTDNTKICDFKSGKTICEPRDKTACEEYSSSSTDCSTITLNGKKCSKVYGLTNCKQVEINDKCKIDTNGNCIDGTAPDPVPETTEKCFFSEDKTKCQLLTCQEKIATDKSTCNSITATTGKICSIVKDEPNCKEVTIDETCQIDSDGNCIDDDSQTDNTKICDFNSGKTTCEPRDKTTCEEYSSSTSTDCSTITLNGKKCSKVYGLANCKQVEINDKCKIDTDGNCIDGTAPDPVPETTEKCFFSEDKTKCQLLTCQEKIATDKSTCNSITATTGKICSIVKDEPNCKEVTIDETCQIDSDGNCIDDDSQTDNTKICDFNSGKTTCEPRDKTTCEEYSSSTSTCSTITVNGKTCSKVYGLANCQEITIDSQCTIDNNGNCELIGTRPSGSCDFDNKRCKFKPCSEYTSKSQCNQVKGCVFLGSCKEFTEGENCQVSYGVCSDTDSPADTENKKCLFDNEKPECIKREKKCENYTTDACNDLTYPNSKKKCVYDGSSGCYEVELDNYCTVDDGNCVEKGDSVLSDTEICDFISKTECKKRKRICEELLSKDICNNYTPINNQFCFKYVDDDLTPCDDITVEDGCQINSSNKCVAKRKQDSCKLDKDNKRCYKSKSEASLLSLKIFSLLFLFFIC